VGPSAPTVRLSGRLSRRELSLGEGYMNDKGLSIPLARAAAFTALLAVGSMSGIAWAQADDGEQSRIRIGFEVAPVPLNMAGKDPALVGLGSYYVNVLDHCNTCHSAGPATEFAKGGNPYFKTNGGAVVNPATYLGGGRVFPLQAPGAPVIVSRNLTPDKTGRPEGGRTFEEFRFIIQTGTDLDRLHLNCSAPGANPNNCYPDNLPFNGELLQIMPWPGLRNLKERDLRAIYEYLSAVPCISGPPGPLHNDCT
jgi:hypothetical protein